MNLFRGQIYCIICLPTGKWYFGQTVKNLEKRFKEHKQAASRGVDFSLYRAIRKYGVENFTVEEVMWVKASTKGALKAKLDFLERHFIKKYDTKKNGYNMTDGGDGFSGITWTQERRKRLAVEAEKRFSKYWGHKHTPESKRKISESNKGRVGVMKGKHHSEEAKRKISKANTGHIGALKGKTFSKEHRQKISEAKRGVKRKPFSEEWKKKLSESHFGNKNHFFGKKHSEDSRRKMSEAKNRRRVV